MRTEAARGLRARVRAVSRPARAVGEQFLVQLRESPNAVSTCRSLLRSSAQPSLSSRQPPSARRRAAPLRGATTTSVWRCARACSSTTSSARRCSGSCSTDPPDGVRAPQAGLGREAFEARRAVLAQAQQLSAMDGAHRQVAVDLLLLVAEFVSDAGARGRRGFRSSSTARRCRLRGRRPEQRLRARPRAAAANARRRARPRRGSSNFDVAARGRHGRRPRPRAGRAPQAHRTGALVRLWRGQGRGRGIPRPTRGRRAGRGRVRAVRACDVAPAPLVARRAPRVGPRRAPPPRARPPARGPRVRAAAGRPARGAPRARPPGVHRGPDLRRRRSAARAPGARSSARP